MLTELLEFLNSITFPLGETNLSLLGILSALFTISIAWFVASLLGKLIGMQIDRIKPWSPSLRVLLRKLTSLGLQAIAVVVALDLVGFDLATLTIFGGALGLGIGFGLQKIVSNLVSGVILLTDHSIKPGDVIEVEGTYGWINNLKARYVSIITRDGTEHLIPNETLITERVINWSFTDQNVRLKIPIGVSYKSDIHLVKKLILQAADDVPRVLTSPPPMCQLVGFGDSSVDFELRIWINDPPNGTANVKSDVLFRVWDLFKENNIEIPFPQRDVHFDAHPSVLEVLAKKD